MTAQPPPDPRDDWQLPPLGALPVVERMDEVCVRVRADNPSPMTLDGTNTYVVMPPGAGVALVVDPGPDEAGHLDDVQGVLSREDADVVGVVATHHHADHAAACRRWAGLWGAPVMAASPRVAGPRGRVLADGDRVDLPGLRVDVVATPGHTRDHLSLRVGTGGLLTGDHILGRGTTVVAHPDGDLSAYLDSLRRIVSLQADVLWPGHGPALAEDPEAVIRYHLLHREHRLLQVCAALGDGPATPRELVAAIYADHDRALWQAAESTTLAALGHLARRGRIAWDGDLARLVS